MNHNRRKSMRLAADPCLGFYVVPTSNSPPCPPAADFDVPPIAVLDSDGSTDGSEEPVVSVDAFLRRSALTRTKTYAKKSRRTIRPADEESADPPRLESYPANRVRHQSKPLKDRILRAAVLSHADADELLLQDDPSRKPLTFVEGAHPSSRSLRTKRRTWSLVDPRKALLARANSFSSRTRGSARNTKTNTLSGWQARIYLDGSMITKKKSTLKPTSCLPLSFIPLPEAEKLYSLMRLPNRVSPSNPREIPESAQPARIPLQLTSHRQHPSSPSPPLLELSALEIPSSPHMSTVPTDLSKTPARKFNPSADDPMLPAITLPIPNSSPTPASNSPAPALTSLAHRESQQTANSTLKPLALFFDQFLQTARAETQLEKHQRKKAPRKSQRRNPVNAPQPICALKGFLRNSVRQTSSAQPFAHPLPSYFPNAPVPSFDMHFRVPSIAASHRAIQATAYQVVLPSTPPTSAQPMLYSTPRDGDNHDMSLGAIDSSINLFCLNARL